MFEKSITPLSEANQSTGEFRTLDLKNTQLGYSPLHRHVATVQTFLSTTAELPVDNSAGNFAKFHPLTRPLLSCPAYYGITQHAQCALAGQNKQRRHSLITVLQQETLLCCSLLPDMSFVFILRPKVCGTERSLLPGNVKAEGTALSAAAGNAVLLLLLLLPADGAEQIADIYICINRNWPAVLSLHV